MQINSVLESRVARDTLLRPVAPSGGQVEPGGRVAEPGDRLTRGPAALDLRPAETPPTLQGLHEVAPSPALGPRHNIDPKYKDYLEQFVRLAAEQGVDLKYIYSQKITVLDMPEKRRTRGRVAEAFLRDKDGIFIYVDPTRFWDGKRSELGRQYVMYHELGHDVLNYDHCTSSGVVGLPGWELSGPMLMRPSGYGSFFSESRSQKDQQEFIDRAIEDVFLYVKTGKGNGVELAIRNNLKKYTLEQVVKMRAQYGTPYTPEEIADIRARYYSDAELVPGGTDADDVDHPNVPGTPWVEDL